MPSVERERVDADDRAFEVLLRDGRVEAVGGEVAPGPRGIVGIRGRVDVQAGNAVDRLENDAAADRPLELGRLLGAVHHLVTDRAEVVLGEQLAGERLVLEGPGRRFGDLGESQRVDDVSGGLRGGLRGGQHPVERPLLVQRTQHLQDRGPIGYRRVHDAFAVPRDGGIVRALLVHDRARIPRRKVMAESPFSWFGHHWFGHHWVERHRSRTSPGAGAGRSPAGQARRSART
ncbi:hypothetical protein ABZV61_37420 [Streptomyces sp900116325]|uniref:Uncharacterized protein n=1 Tax=Streptomyces sp. 900116325 TaxID=3154295 RepID=A0ABV2UKD7_9ACTN